MNICKTFARLDMIYCYQTKGKLLEIKKIKESIEMKKTKTRNIKKKVIVTAIALASMACTTAVVMSPIVGYAWSRYK